MPKNTKCVWCLSHYSLPERGCYLCSFCNEAYQTGLYQMNKNLRELPQRDGKRQDFREYLSTRDSNKGNLSMGADKRVKDMITPNFMKTYFKIVAKCRYITPYLLWKFFDTNNLWIDTAIYKEIKKLPKCSSWRYVHALCPRVLDPWNFTGGGIEECYYRANVRWHDIIDGHYPSGEIVRKRDVMDGDYARVSLSQSYVDDLLIC